MRAKSSKQRCPALCIVRLVSREKRNEIYANRFKAKDIEGFSIADMKKLCVNKNLKQRRKRLFWNTKQKFRSYMADLKPLISHICFPIRLLLYLCIFIR